MVVSVSSCSYVICAAGPFYVNENYATAEYFEWFLLITTMLRNELCSEYDNPLLNAYQYDTRIFSE